MKFSRVPRRRVRGTRELLRTILTILTIPTITTTRPGLSHDAHLVCRTALQALYLRRCGILRLPRLLVFLR